MRKFLFIVLFALFFDGCSTSKLNTITDTYIPQKECQQKIATLIVGKIEVDRSLNQLSISQDEFKRALFQIFGSSKCIVLANQDQTDRFLEEKFIFDATLSSKKYVDIDDGLLMDKKKEGFEVSLSFKLKEFDTQKRELFINSNGFAESEKTTILGIGKNENYANIGKNKALDKALKKALYEIEKSLVK